MEKGQEEARGFAWEGLKADFGTEETATTPVVEEKKEQVEEKDPNELSQGEEKPEKTEANDDTKEVKTEAKEEVKEEKKEENSETKTEEEKKEEPVIELKVTDVEGYKEKAEDGTWKAVGELFEVDVPNESPEAFKASIEAKYNAKIEEAKKYSLEQEYAKLKPETVAALKLIEMGVPEEQAFNPTAQHQQYLSLDDASLVRADLEAREGWDEERVNLEMESLSERPEKLKHEALKVRESLQYQMQEILATRDAKLNEYTQNKERAIAEQQAQSFNQVKEAVMSIDSFMGAKITPEAKAAILQKHSRGDYGSVQGDGKTVAELLYFKEFGHKILEETKRTSYAKGREEYAKKELLKIPDNSNEHAKKVVEKVTNNQSKGPSILANDFG